MLVLCVFEKLDDVSLRLWDSRIARHVSPANLASVPKLRERKAEKVGEITPRGRTMAHTRSEILPSPSSTPSGQFLP